MPLDELEHLSPGRIVPDEVGRLCIAVQCLQHCVVALRPYTATHEWSQQRAQTVLHSVIRWLVLSVSIFIRVHLSMNNL